MRRTLALVATAVIAMAACGGDDDDSSAATNADAPAESGSDDSEDFEDFIAPEVSEDDDVISQILAKVFGLPPSFLTAEGRACVSAELAPLFPDGVVPDDIQLTDELATALDDAGETCQVDFQG